MVCINTIIFKNHYVACLNFRSIIKLFCLMFRKINKNPLVLLYKYKLFLYLKWLQLNRIKINMLKSLYLPSSFLHLSS